MAPESYQVSMTSGTRRASSPQSGQANATSSMYGRCGSSSDRSRPATLPSSVSDPIAVAWRFAQRQIGSGVPQYRDRDSAQSTLFLSQSPYRPSRMWAGYQFTPWFTSRRRSFLAVVRTYQDVRAMYSSGVLHRQHS